MYFWLHAGFRREAIWRSKVYDSPYDVSSSSNLHTTRAYVSVFILAPYIFSRFVFFPSRFSAARSMVCWLVYVPLSHSAPLTLLGQISFLLL